MPEPCCAKFMSVNLHFLGPGKGSAHASATGGSEVVPDVMPANWAA
jgi:hypothetical protein